MTDIESLSADVRAGLIAALSIRQPWPHRIFREGKDIENRSWPTRRRGWFMIHAGVSTEEIDLDFPADRALPRGGIVGLARIVDCVKESESRWFFGPYGFTLASAFPIPLIPCRGKLGFFTPEADIRDAVADAVDKYTAAI